MIIVCILGLSVNYDQNFNYYFYKKYQSMFNWHDLHSIPQKTRILHESFYGLCCQVDMKTAHTYLLTCLLACACSFLFRMLFVNFFCLFTKWAKRKKEKNNNNVIEPLFSTWALISWARKIDFGKFSGVCELMDEDNYVIKKVSASRKCRLISVFFLLETTENRAVKLSGKLKEWHFLERDFYALLSLPSCKYKSSISRN